MNQILSECSSGDMSVLYLQDDDGTVSLAVIPFREESRIILNKDCQPEPLVQLKILGDDYPSYFSQGRTMRSGKSTFGFRYERQSVEAHAHGQNIHTVLRDPRGYVCTHILRTDSRSQSVGQIGYVPFAPSHAAGAP